jgi:alpha-1,2-rhamnosyltransferase
VRNIVNFAPRAHSLIGVECQGISYTASGGFQRVAAICSLSDEAQAPLPSSPFQSLKQGARQTLTALRLLETARRVKRLVKAQVNTVQNLVADESKSNVRLGRGDLLLMIDTTWDTPEVWDAVRVATSRGASVGALVYDLIPIRYPEMYGSISKVFCDWFAKLAYYSDFLICISGSVWDDTQDYLKQNRIRNRHGAELRGDYFRLGAGLDKSCDSVSVRPELANLYANHPSQNPYLALGSFDPRKNLVTVIRAFERLWAAGSQLKLVTIGRPYTGCTPLERLVADHPEQGRRLVSFRDIEDGELDYCYRRSASLITASFAEGFNLPIVESLQRGRPVLAADIPVHREVAGRFAHYFPAHQPNDLADLISRQQSGAMPDALAPVRDFYWPDWPTSCQEFLGKAAKMYAMNDES